MSPVFKGSWGLNSRPHACLLKARAMEQSPQPQVASFECSILTRNPEAEIPHQKKKKIKKSGTVTPHLREGRTL